MPFIRRGALASVLTVAALALPATALAATPVVTAIKAQQNAIKSSPAVQKLITDPPKTKAAAKKDIPLFAAVQKKLTKAASTVGASSATSKQKAAKAQWISGVNGVAKGYGQLIAAFRLIGGSNRTAYVKQIKTAVTTLKAAEVQVAKADKALGIAVPKA